MALFDVLLERLVEAPSDAAFDELFGQHGPIQPGEMDLLAERARDSDPRVRRNATLLLGLARTDDRRVLLDVLARETTDPRVFVLAARALPGGAELARARPELVRQALADGDPKVRSAAVELGGHDANDPLLDPDRRVRAAALDRLAKHGPGESEALLRALLVDPTRRRGYSLEALYGALLYSDDPATSDAFARSLEGASPSDASALVNAIGFARHRPGWLRAFLIGQLATAGRFRWSALRLLAEAPEPPLVEMVTTCRDYLAHTLATGAVVDEGLSACAAFLGGQFDRPFADMRDVLAFAEAWLAQHAQGQA